MSKSGRATARERIRLERERAARRRQRNRVLDIYEDFQCPVCDAFEKANGAVVQKLAFQPAW